MTCDRDFFIALDGLEKSLLWKSVSMILNQGDFASTSSPRNNENLLTCSIPLLPSSTFVFFSKLISSKECRRPLCNLLFQLGYGEFDGVCSLVARKLLSSIILLYYYDQSSEDSASDNEILLYELKQVSKSLWGSVKCALSLFSNENLGQILLEKQKISTHEKLKKEIDSYLALFDRWKESDLNQLHSSIDLELDSIEKLKQITEGSPEWMESINSYSSLLLTTKNNLPIKNASIDRHFNAQNSDDDNYNISGQSITSSCNANNSSFQSIPVQLKNNPALARAQSLYDIIIQGPDEFISKKYSNKNHFSIFPRSDNEHSETLIRLRAFHSNTLRKIKKALLEIVTIGEATFKGTRLLSEDTNHGQKQDYQFTLPILIEKDFSISSNDISLKDLIFILRKTLSWLALIVSFDNSTVSSILAEDIQLLSTSMDVFYNRQSIPSIQITEPLITERKLFLITFYNSLDGILYRTYCFALEQAVTSLILPFVSEKKYLKEYFDAAYATASFANKECFDVDNIQAQLIKSLSMTGSELSIDLLPFFWFDFSWIKTLSNTIANWAFFISTFTLIKEFLVTIDQNNYDFNAILSSIAEKMEISTDPLKTIISEWEIFCRQSIATPSQPANMNFLESLQRQKEKHPVVKLFSKRLREAVVENGMKVYQALFPSTLSNYSCNKTMVPTSMHTGRSLIVKMNQLSIQTNESGWWSQWNSFFSALNNYRQEIRSSSDIGISQLSIHPSLCVPGDVIREILIFPASIEVAKRIGFYRLLYSDSSL